MKKLFSLLFFVPVTLIIVLIYSHALLLAPQNKTVFATGDGEQFARIKFAGVYLYKTPTLNESYINMYFEIPNTYFVKLLSDANDYFYRAQYMEQIGYVKKLEVQPISGIPLHPYVSATFRVFSSDGAMLKDAPFYASNAVAALPQNQNILQYIGRISGEEAIIGRGNVWYFCKFGNSSGYVYGGLSDMLSEILPNTEIFENAPNPFITPVLSYIEYLKTSNVKFVVIVAVLLPSFAIFYLLYMKITPKNKTRNTQKFKEVKTIKPQYLYDDHEL
ncbi:MAG: hypothetical protein LBN07_02425 [Christensenellaceae bacterium]|jgi:hypothetical protein|nr:hypothetical protein [Christensenellaceae bacterium]